MLRRALPAQRADSAGYINCRGTAKWIRVVQGLVLLSCSRQDERMIKFARRRRAGVSRANDETKIYWMRRPAAWGRLCGRMLVVWLGVAGAALGEEVGAMFTKGPYLQGPGTDTMTIKWESPTNTPAIVRYGLNGKTDQQVRIETPHQLALESYRSLTNLGDNGETKVERVATTNFVFLYEVALKGLRPESVYTYSAEMEGLKTLPKKLKTFSLQQPKVTFITYGDTRTNPKNHSAVAANFKRYSPDFILHAGDLVADGRRYELWSREFFDPLSEVLDEIPILPSLGNHEQDGSKYLFYMRLPGKDRWYSYDIGPVHVLALDFRFEKETDEQFAFAKKDLLAAKTAWKVVFLHYPVFNIGGHATAWGHASYLPLFHRAKVDLVLSGHSHIYERFRPIAGRTGSDRWPITHITTGGGGAPLATSYPHPALVSNYATNHFVLIEATATTLRGRAITTNNSVIDSFELKKRNGEPITEYLAQVYPEEALKMTWEAAPSLMGSLAAVPETNSAAPAMFTIRPIKASEKPVELEISLMPASAQSYELEGGPLRVTAPMSSEPDKVVWVNVKATGKVAAGGIGGEFLSPQLMFQGKMKVGAVETVAYGQRCRITEAAAQAARVRDGR